MGPLISAHRGECGVPDLPAVERYRRALDLGVDYIELDVRRTADGAYIVYHDDATASGQLIRDLTHEEVRAELGHEALALEELLRIAKGRAGLHIDLKEVGYEAEIVRLALAHSPAGEFVITSGEDESIQAIKEQFPHVRAGLTLGRDVAGEPVWRRLGVRVNELFPGRRLKRCHANFVAAHWQLARTGLLRYCARTQMPIWVWTVDDEAEIARFLDDPRVTALITNRPDVALRLRGDGGQDASG